MKNEENKKKQILNINEENYLNYGSKELRFQRTKEKKKE